jgi:hypothetical protein
LKAQVAPHKNDRCRRSKEGQDRSGSCTLPHRLQG